MQKRYFIILIWTIFHCMVILSPCYAQKHQHGKASFYSKRATGARSASGQKIHHDSLTCAHRYFPFGTHLKVTNLRNGKSVIVKVIDRGPFGRGRIIDLSWAAAKEIDMIAQGVGTVKVERMDNPIPYRPEDTKLPKIDFEIAEFEPQTFSQKEEKYNKEVANHHIKHETKETHIKEVHPKEGHHSKDTQIKEAQHKEQYQKEPHQKESSTKEKKHK